MAGLKSKKRIRKPTARQKFLNSLDVELAKSIWMQKGLILESPVRLFRWRGAGPRRYFTYSAPVTKKKKTIFPVEWFNSVTSMIETVFPTSSFLIEWIAKVGLDKAKLIADEAKDYGTVLHAAITKFLLEAHFSLLRDVDDLIMFHVKQNDWKWDVGPWKDRLRRDLVSFAQFAHDVQLEPICIEAVLCHEGYHMAGAIDCVAWMNVVETGFFGQVYAKGGTKNPAGSPKKSKKTERILALLDWKSCRKGFYPEHEIQLQLYKVLWDFNFGFGKFKLNRLFNWRPTDWHKEPKYQLKDQTNNRRTEVPFVIGLAQERLEAEPAMRKAYPKEIRLREKPAEVTWIQPQEIALEHFGAQKQKQKTGRKK